MKRTPDLDFALDRAAHQRWKKIFFVVLGLGFGLQIGIAAWRLQSLESARAALDSQYRTLTDKSSHFASTRLSAEQIKTAVAAQSMLENLTAPWENLLGAVEAASTKRVLVDAIQPRTQESSVSISVSSADFAGLAEFIQRLAEQEFLHDVMLVSETLPESGGGSLRAVINANWRQKK